MGYFGLGSILAFALGPNIGLWLVNNYSYAVCFLASAAISALSLIPHALVPYRHQPSEAAAVRKKLSLSSFFAKELTLYILLQALFSCGNGLLPAYIALIGEEQGIANIGMYYTAYSIVLIFIRPRMGKIMDKKGLATLLYPSILLAGVAMWLISSANALWIMILAGIINAVGSGAGAPSIQAHAVRILGRDCSGVASSSCYIGMDIGNSITPIAGGVMASAMGYGTIFHLFALLLVIAGLAIFTLQRTLEKRKAASENSL